MASPKPTPKPKVMAKPTAKATVKPKPKATPTPKFTAPSVAEFRKSAAYITDSMGYKEYIDAMYRVHQAKYKKK
jgi:outer membrane biosynthesis protein TonB